MDVRERSHRFLVCAMSATWEEITEEEEEEREGAAARPGCRSLRQISSTLEAASEMK